MMKKYLKGLLTIALTLGMAISLTGCGGDSEDNEDVKKEEKVSESNTKDDNKDEKKEESKACYDINSEHMSHFMIDGFNIDSSYCAYIYDYRDYIDTLKIYFVADMDKQVEVATEIFNKSGSKNRMSDVEIISDVSQAKYWTGNSYQFYNDEYIYKIDFIETAGEESIFNDREIKANSVLIQIEPCSMWFGDE